MFLPVAHYLLAAVSYPAMSAADSGQMNVSQFFDVVLKLAAVTGCVNSVMLLQKQAGGLFVADLALKFGCY